MLISLNFVVLCDFIGLFELKIPNLKVFKFHSLSSPIDDMWSSSIVYSSFFILSSFTTSSVREFLSFRNFRFRLPKFWKSLSYTLVHHIVTFLFLLPLFNIFIFICSHFSTLFFRQIFLHLSISFFFLPTRVLVLIGGKQANTAAVWLRASVC